MHQPKQPINADEPNVPRVTRATNLGFKITGVSTPNDNQDGAIAFLNSSISDQFAPISCDGLQIYSVSISRFDLNNESVFIWRNPEAIKTNFPRRSTVATLLDTKTKTCSYFVYDIL